MRKLTWDAVRIHVEGVGGLQRSLFFFSSRRRHTRFSRDWSSDVCSSDLWQKRSMHATTSSAGRPVNAAMAFGCMSTTPCRSLSDRMTAHRPMSGQRPHSEPRVRELRSEEHTSELQSRENLVCRLLLEKKK